MMRYVTLMRFLPLKKGAKAIATAILLGLAAVPAQSPRGQTRSDDKDLSIVLWARQVNPHARYPLYWVNDTPVGRDDLNGVARAIGSTDPSHVQLTVIVDSRLPIDEIKEIDWTMAKVPITHARYFTFWVAYPGSMQEVILKSEQIPVPKPPPIAPSKR
jgi:hypothetical protein